MTLEELKYPIGPFTAPEEITSDLLDIYIDDIIDFPNHVMKTIKKCDEAKLNTPYRPEGWTLRQVIHHCADSHMNAFIRFKLSLTETQPTIKPYQEALWAELSDSKSFPIEGSLQILQGVHARWGQLLQSMKRNDFQLSYVHPEKGTVMTLAAATALYAWHCNHHLAHMELVMKGVPTFG